MTKVAGGRTSSEYFCGSDIFKTIIVNLRCQLLSIFLFFILNKNTLRFACYKNIQKSSCYILSLHIRSSALLRYAKQNDLSLPHTALVGNYISSYSVTIFAGKSYQSALLELNLKLIFHYITLKIWILHPKSKLSTLERA